MGVMDGPSAGATANPPPQPQQDFAGRRDLDDLKQAYRASGQEAIRQKQRADMLEQQMQAMQAAVNPHPDVPSRGHSPVFQRLNDLGIPADDVLELVRGEIRSEFEPMARMIQGQARARNDMLANYGKDYVQFEQDVARFIQSDMEMQQRYNVLFVADPTAAAEYAFLKFGEAKRRDAPPAQNGQPDLSQQAQAAVPTGGQGQGRDPNVQGDQQIAAAWEAFQQNPSRQNAERYANLRMSQAISDDFLEGRIQRR